MVLACRGSIMVEAPNVAFQGGQIFKRNYLNIQIKIRRNKNDLFHVSYEEYQLVYTNRRSETKFTAKD